jgi:hypothetical protein
VRRSGINWSKTGKIAKKRYKSVITKKNLHKIKKQICHTDQACDTVSLHPSGKL